MSTLTQYARAAQAIPMAWLTQAEFPGRQPVRDSFRAALEELPAPSTYADSVVRSALETIVSGPDPRGGAFKAQAIHAAAQLLDRLAVLVIEAAEEVR